MIAAAPAPRVHHLTNGVTLVCDPAAGFETLALSVVAGRGSRWEGPDRSGWSHLLEHMVFKGAGPRSARAIVESIEADGGQLNAATGHERTSFQLRALRDGLPLGMEVIADLVQRPSLDSEDLAREKQVVVQEIAEAADTPDDQVFEQAQAAAFADQPLGRPILGSESSIGSADPAALASWRAALYSPDRLVVSVAGAVDETEFLRLAERLFGDAAAGDASEPDAARFTGGHARERRKLEQAHLVFLLPATGVSDPGYWPLRIFAEALGGGMSSRLFQEARERLGLAYAIDAYAEGYAEVGVLGIYAGCAPADAGRLAEVAAQQIKALLAEVGDDELARAKAQLKASLFMSRESLLSRAEQAALQILTLGEIQPPIALAMAIDAVGPAEIRGLGATLVSPGRSTVSVLGPRAAMDAPARFETALFG
jgi:predicted Zn-dependent peptidase